jgi:hypothetical protein
MSNRFITAVWNTSPEIRGGDLLVLLALADRADERGVCWPGKKDIARRCRVLPRAVQRSLRKLESAGAIKTLKQAGDHATNKYQLTIDGGSLPRLRGESSTTPGGVFHDSGGESSTTPKPSLNPHNMREREGDPSLNEAMDHAKGQHWPTDAVEEWHAHREGQGWVRGNGHPITNWRADLQSWILRNAREAAVKAGARGKSTSSKQSKYADRF